MEYRNSSKVTEDRCVTRNATKAGYEDSDVATMEFSIGDTGQKGDVNGDGVVDTQDAIKIIRIYLKKE